MSGKGWRVRAGFKARALFPGEAVQYQGQLYPGQLRAACTHDDGLEVELEVTMTASGPVPVRATLEHPDGLGSIDRVPFATLARQAAAAVAVDPDEERGTWNLPDRRTVDELQLVADLYRAAVDSGQPVTREVHRGLAEAGVYRSMGTVSKLIHKARRTVGPDGSTYLPATERGRKKA